MSEMEQLPVYRIALGIEYDGSKYYGWQRQNEVRSVQEKLEKALSQVANEPINVFCAGRTDAGVHGTGQVVHFETHAARKDAAWTLGVNANLPGDIAVRWVKAVPDDFHARFSGAESGGDALSPAAGRRAHAPRGAKPAGRKRLYFVPRGAVPVAYAVA